MRDKFTHWRSPTNPKETPLALGKIKFSHGNNIIFNNDPSQISPLEKPNHNPTNLKETSLALEKIKFAHGKNIVVNIDPNQLEKHKSIG